MSTPQLQIVVDEERREFEPREEVSGGVSWVLQSPPDTVELRLFWYTEGKGTRDVRVVETVAFEASPEGLGDFRIRLPASPYSFSGRLFSIRWALELVAEPSGESQRVDLVMGPGGREVEVHEGS